MSDQLDAVRKYFKVTTSQMQKGQWLIACEKCGSQWHLSKSSNHAGNILHLLNHARSHDKKTRKQAALDALNDE